MAVLVEAISVIIRRDSIDRKLPGGWDAFEAAVPNATLCSDNAIARVGFMAPDDVRRFIERLCTLGLTFIAEGRAVDMAVVDQQRGLTTDCDWLEFGRLSFGKEGGEVAACWLFEGARIAAGIHVHGRSMELATPAGWDFEGSLSQRFGFAPTAEKDKQLRFLRRDGSTDVYLDLATGEEVYVPRID